VSFFAAQLTAIHIQFSQTPIIFYGTVGVQVAGEPSCPTVYRSVTGLAAVFTSDSDMAESE